MVPNVLMFGTKEKDPKLLFLQDLCTGHTNHIAIVHPRTHLLFGYAAAERWSANQKCGIT